MTDEKKNSSTFPDDNLTLQDFMPLGVTTNEQGEYIAYSGGVLEASAVQASKEDLIEGIKTVYDPEIPVNLYDLGLIYEIRQDEKGNVFVEMTLTAPGCPVAGEMPKMVATALSKVSGIGLIEVKLVWDPPWTKELMSEDARLVLGF